ncbi:MAG: FAD-binding domain-containing protein [Pseudomonadota bacterium]
MTAPFAPNHTAALEALQAFVPKSGKDYASLRNYDRDGHPHVSQLSPYLRHRVLTEADVLEAVLARFAPSTAEKFVQEVFWRTYFKGWMEMRPSVWTAYRADLARARDRLATEGGLRKGWEQACSGATGIEPFDHWAQELAQTGYMHNHARMWFASIWTFTLGLPWELGADFFQRHLLDGDPASNTLGWRWVVGLHTPGKVYAARSSNITKYTDGRFGGVHGLPSDPAPAPGTPNPPRGTLPLPEMWDPAQPTGLLLTEDDLSPGWLFDGGLAPKSNAVLAGVLGRSPLDVSDTVLGFTAGVIEDARKRFAQRLGTPGPVTGVTRGESEENQRQALLSWAADEGLAQVVVPHAPVGPAADRLAPLRRALEAEGVRVIAPIRAYDLEAWPHATHGFFRFKEKIPRLIAGLKGLRAA